MFVITRTRLLCPPANFVASHIRKRGPWRMSSSAGAGSIWRNREFVKFWTGESISQLGSQITLLALPLTAVITLNATPGEMGVLNALFYLPFLALGLFVGVWIDRVRRRPIMITSALCRAAVLASVPLLYVLHLLTIGYLYVAGLMLGTFMVLFELTYQAYLPSLVERDELVAGNSKLQVSASTAQVGGPALAGWLVRWLTAPTALLFDAVSFLVSAVSLIAVRKKESPPERERPDSRVWQDIGEGLRFTFGNASLRACVLEAGTYNMFWLVLETVFLLYANRHLGMSTGAIGLVLGGGALGALAGALIAERLAARFGLGTVVSVAMTLGCAAPVLVPLASGPRWVIFTLFTLAFFLGGAGTTVANIQVVSLRQAITPPAMLGRMNASYRFVAWGTVPLGSLLGGALGEAIGLRPTLFVAAAGMFCAALWIVFSPIRRTREIPGSPDGPGAARPADKGGDIPREPHSAEVM
jgi:MFS family permease